MKRRSSCRIPVIAMMALAAMPAHAGIPVFDVMNFASNVVQNVQLFKIQHSLTDHSQGTVVYNTTNIDNSTKSIDRSTKKIDKSTSNIDISTTNISKITNKNYEINAEFTWIINKGGDEIIPIPKELAPKPAAIHGGGLEAYIANFKDAGTYAAGVSGDKPEGVFEGSRARKAANDMLVHSIELEQAAMKDELAALKSIKEAGEMAQGHGNQLQVANALSVSQINQLMKLRNSMLVTEAQRAAEAQVAADKDARAIATGVKLRAGLAQAIAAAPELTATH